MPTSAVIYVIGNAEDAHQHQQSAEYISGKLNTEPKLAKYGYDPTTGDRHEVRVFDNAGELKSHLSTQGHKVSKVFILAHGNWEVVGPDEGRNAYDLAVHLWTEAGFEEWMNRGKNALYKVNLLTCMSGSPNPSQEEDRHGVIYVEQLASALKDWVPKNKTLIVKGVSGLSFTTNQGHNLAVQMDGTSEAEFKEIERAIAQAEGNLNALKGALPKKTIGKASTKYTVKRGFAQSS